MSEEATPKNEKKQQFNEIDYSIIDPILKENPRISYKEFLKKSKIKISAWSLSNRRKFINTGKQYDGTVPGDKSSNGSVTLKQIYDKCIPPTTSMRKDYENVAALLIEDITLSHATLKEKGQVKMCDANFYQFRKKIRELIQNKKIEEPKTITPRRKKILYSIIFEKEIKGISNESREFLQEFINELNTRKNMGLEIAEVIFPNHKIEVRSYS